MVSSLLLLIGTVLLLLLVSAFFSGSETGLTAASKARLHRLEQSGSKNAKRVRKLLDDKESLIGALLLGNNLMNIAATAIATSMLTDLFGEQGVVYATAVMTVAVLVLAEILPKTYAIQFPERVALLVAPVVVLLIRVLSPFVSTTRLIVRGLLRLMGIKLLEGAHFVSPYEEIRDVINLQSREGGLQKSSRDMLGSILELDEVSVADIMVHRRSIEMLDADAPIETIISQIQNSRFTRIPLWRGNHENIVGILHAKNVLREVWSTKDNLQSLNLERMSSEPWFVPQTTTLREQMNAFRQRRNHFALIVDEYGDLMGLVTLEDILEEIVGDISDEYDLPISGLRLEADGGVLIDGTVPIRDLNRRFDWDLPDEEATTIAGLVIHEAQTIPQVGQHFSFHGFGFEILRRQRNQITRLKITPPALPPADTAS